ncbi:MAG: hypothetical protein HY268_33950 [Deltaproteobacteria bacterium]|nr:hypothetical protein [Deltaproteobacteria bacterium]
MNTRILHFGLSSLIVVLLLGGLVSVFAQIGDNLQPQLGPPLKPLIKLVGFLNEPTPATSPKPVLTVALAGDDRRYTFTLTDMRIMAGPLITPGDILSQVKPFSTNFYLRGSPDIMAQISDTAPGEQLSILAEYSRADRVLFVQSVEKSEEPRRQ